MHPKTGRMGEDWASPTRCNDVVKVGLWNPFGKLSKILGNRGGDGPLLSSTLPDAYCQKNQCHCLHHLEQWRSRLLCSWSRAGLRYRVAETGARNAAWCMTHRFLCSVTAERGVAAVRRRFCWTTVLGWAGEGRNCHLQVHGTCIAAYCTCNRPLLNSRALHAVYMWRGWGGVGCASAWCSGRHPGTLTKGRRKQPQGTWCLGPPAFLPSPIMLLHLSVYCER